MLQKSQELLDEFDSIYKPLSTKKEQALDIFENAVKYLGLLKKEYESSYGDDLKRVSLKSQIETLQARLCTLKNENKELFEEMKNVSDSYLPRMETQKREREQTMEQIRSLEETLKKISKQYDQWSVDFGGWFFYSRTFIPPKYMNKLIDVVVPFIFLPTPIRASWSNF